jgi:hypothetical protein
VSLSEIRELDDISFNAILLTSDDIASNNPPAFGYRKRAKEKE